MKKFYIFLFLAVFSVSNLFGQETRTINNNGNWDASGTWQGGNIASSISHNVSMNNNAEVTVRNGFSYGVGHITLGNGNNVTIASGGTLTIGTTAQNRHFTTNNNAEVYVHGNLVINGNLIVNNNLTLIVTGSLSITGNVQLNNNAELNIDGLVDVGGNFSAGDNTILDVNGTINVGGNFSVGANSTASGNGTINHGGACNDNGSNVCGSSILPVVLKYFEGNTKSKTIVLNWATAKEDNFKYFEIQRSADAVSFEVIGKIDGAGNSNQTIKYAFTDYNPIKGQNYYRLKAIDIDGTYEYFSIIAVQANFKPELDFTVSPNPFNGQYFKLNISNENGTYNQVSIHDLSGNEVFKSNFQFGENEFTLNQPLPQGLYIMIVQAGNEIKKAKVFVK
jgi:hypothetical protein